MKQELFKQVYTLAIEGFPAKKICRLTRRDKGQISHIIKAFVDLGFLQCISGQDKVKIYEATSKVFTGERKIVEFLSQQIKTKAKGYGGRYKRYHNINFKADVISWGKLPKKWDDCWVTKGTRFCLLRFEDAVFIRCKGKFSDTLRLIIPDIIWNEARESPEDYKFKQARLLMGSFSSRYNIRLRGLVECVGTSCAITVRHPELVRLAQERTIKFSNGLELDSSHGQPELEGPIGLMDELLSLPTRVSQLEQEMGALMSMFNNMSKRFEDVSKKMDNMSSQMDRMEKLFSQPVTKDEKRDVT